MILRLVCSAKGVVGFELLGFGGFMFRKVPEHQHHTAQSAVGFLDRSPAVVDGYLSAVPRDLMNVLVAAEKKRKES